MPMLRPLLLPALSLSIGLALAALPALAADNALRDQVAGLFKQRQWAEAQVLLEKATADEPNNAEAWNALGQTFLARGDYEKAIPPLEKATQLDAGKSEYYNLGTGGGSSVHEVIAACRKITGRKIDTVEKPRRLGDPPRLIASSEKIKRELGWKPQFQSLDRIIESAWKWHQKFPNGYED